MTSTIHYTVTILGLFCIQLAGAQKKIYLTENTEKDLSLITKEMVVVNPQSQDSIYYNVNTPSLTAFIPPYYLATGTAVVIAPGGAFHILSYNNEGTKVAQKLNELGIAAFVLKYSLTSLPPEKPLETLRERMQNFKTLDSLNEATVSKATEEGLKAVAYIRKNHHLFDIDPEKIGFMGFSAGGTLTLSVVYSAQKENRPNFVAPIYPYEPAILGSTVPQEKTPLFLAVAADDELDMLPYSLNIFNKWNAEGQAAELHVYQKGGHGFGMRNQNLTSDSWFDRFADWLKMQGYLQKKYPNKYEKLYGQEAVAQGKIDRVKRLMDDYPELTKYGEEERVPEQKINAVFLGDSITEGWLLTDPDFFEENTYLGRGISGQTSAQLVLRFRQDVLQHRPKVLVLHIGTNDIAENTGTYKQEYTLGNIKTMVTLAQENNIKVVLCGVLPATKFEWNRALGNQSQKIVELNQALQAFCSEKGIPFVDYHQVLKNSEMGMKSEYSEDGVHPNKKGFDVMKQTLTPVLLEVLNQSKEE